MSLFRDQTTNVFPVVDKVRIDFDLNLFNVPPCQPEYFGLLFLHVGQKKRKAGVTSLSFLNRLHKGFDIDGFSIRLS